MDKEVQNLQETRTAAYSAAVLRAVEFELEGSVAHAGMMMTGFSVKFGDGECLLTVRGVLAGRPQIAFVGSSDLGNCILKVVRDALSDKLKFRDDKFG